MLLTGIEAWSDKFCFRGRGQHQASSPTITVGMPTPTPTPIAIWSERPSDPEPESPGGTLIDPAEVVAPAKAGWEDAGDSAADVEP